MSKSEYLSAEYFPIETLCYLSNKEIVNRLRGREGLSDLEFLLKNRLSDATDEISKLEKRLVKVISALLDLQLGAKEQIK